MLKNFKSFYHIYGLIMLFKCTSLSFLPWCAFCWRYLMVHPHPPPTCIRFPPSGRINEAQGFFDILVIICMCKFFYLPLNPCFVVWHYGMKASLSVQIIWRKLLVLIYMYHCILASLSKLWTVRVCKIFFHQLDSLDLVISFYGMNMHGIILMGKWVCLICSKECFVIFEWI